MFCIVARPLGKKVDADIEALPISRHAKYQKQWEREGKCRSCGTRKPAPGKLDCWKCIAYQRAYHREYQQARIPRLREERKDAGLCARCGIRLARKSRVNCPRCAQMAREANMRYL